MREEPFDIVLCVGSQHADIAYKTVLGILTYFNYANIWIISNPRTLDKLKLTLPFNKQLIYLEEDKIIPEVSLEKLKEYFKRRDAQPSRAGWYYQQFLKMSMSLHCQSTHYLIWDADTIPLRNIQFLNKNKSLIQTSSEYHRPYFDVIKSLLNLDKLIPKSFITEHMMVSKAIMKELIGTIQNTNQKQHWVFNILSLIDKTNLSQSGFSEYETYGTYALSNYSFAIQIRDENLRSFRSGTRVYTPNPSFKNLEILKKLNYDYVTFEVWDNHSKKATSKNKKLAELYYIVLKLKLTPLANMILKHFEKKIKKIIE